MRRPAGLHLEKKLMKNRNADGGGKFVYLAAAVSALGSMLFDYDIGVISGASHWTAGHCPMARLLALPTGF